MAGLVYTLRTFPRIDYLKTLFPQLIVFGQLKEDLAGLGSFLLGSPVDLVLGIAKGDRSFVESVAINDIHGNRIIKDGPAELSLFTPKQNFFPVRNKATNSFCNYSIYKIAYFIKQENLSINASFIHINLKDMDKLRCFLSKINPLNYK